MTKKLSDAAKRIIKETLREEETVREVADAIYGVAVKQALKMSESIPVDCAKIQRVLDEALVNTDRAAAILIFSLIDDLFIFYLSQFLNKEISGGTKSLFNSNGMLSTSHNRITFAASLYWISSNTYKDLKILKKIRNEFAHKTEIHAFSEKTIESMIMSLMPYEDSILNVHLENPLQLRKLTAREIFLVRSSIITCNLIRELIWYRSAITHQVGIKDMYVGWDEGAENVKEISRCIAKFSLKVLRSCSSDDFLVNCSTITPQS